MLQNLPQSSTEWLATVMADFDAFLLDHAACERKASAMAMSFVMRYPDRTQILDPMILLARGELTHFHRVFRICIERGFPVSKDTKDPYVNGLLKLTRNGRDENSWTGWCSQRSWRACAATNGLDGSQRPFRPGISKTSTPRLRAQKSGMQRIFLDTAEGYFDKDRIQERLKFFLKAEAELLPKIPLRAALH